MNQKESYPSLFQQTKNLAKFSWKLIKYLQEKSEDEENKSLLAPEEVYEKRMKICKKCPKYDEKQNRCIECGCYLPMKAKFALDDCPLNKWIMDEEDWEKVFDNIIKDMNE